MSETLWIKLTAGAAAGEPLPWARLDAAGRVLARGRDLPSALKTGLPCRAVAASDKVLWTRIAPPGRRRLEGPALTFALEERLADSPEAVHAVLGAVRKDGMAQVAVVDLAWFAGSLEALDKAGLRPLSVVAEPALLPGSETEWHLVWGDEALLRLADGLCLHLSPDPATARQLLQLALGRGEGAPERLVIHAESGRNLPEPAEFAHGLAVSVVSGPDYDWAVAAQAAGRPDVELLQGRFSGRGQGEINWRPWRPVAWLAAVLVLANLAGLMIDAGLKVWQVRHINQANRGIFMQAFPETKVVVDPVIQMHRQVADLNHKAGATAATDFMPMLAGAGAVLPSSARAGVREIRYRPGSLTLLLPAGQGLSADWRHAGFRVFRQPSQEKGWDELTLEAGS